VQDDVDRRLERIAELASTLPEAQRAALTDQHTAFVVRKKTFAYHLVDHHGDGRVALCCKAAPGENTALIAGDPARYFLPPYVGPRGWVGLDLDAAPVDWDEIRELLTDSYRLVAPKTLVRRLDESA
jgi:hypothetical protein